MKMFDRIEEQIVAISEGFFDEPDDRENLHLTIRIARDFYNFLVKFDEHPPAKEIDYMIGTIRSGMDEFFALAYGCAVITGSETWIFDRYFGKGFPALRERFLSGVEELAVASDLEGKLKSLLSLVHLEFAFMADNFPLAILGQPAVSSETTEKADKDG